MSLANINNLLALGMPAALATELGNQVSPLITGGSGPVSGALNTVGAGTITAALMTSAIILRGGAQSATAFTDTTATAALIIAALPNAGIGQSWRVVYRNNTDGDATITGGTGVTVTGGIVPKNSWAEFVVKYTAAATITMDQYEIGTNVRLPPAKFTTGTAATFAAGDITGADVVHYINSASNATLTVRTAAQMFADIPNCQVGFAYTLLIRNTNATGATITADGGATVTLTGTMTIAQNVTRTFTVTFTSATAATIQSMGISAAAA